MPYMIPTPCRKPGCGVLTRESCCAFHKDYEKAIKADYEKRYSHKRNPLYSSVRWTKARNSYAARNPL